MDDLISRQAAIDALKNRWKKTRNYEGIGDDIAEECELYLKQVPSAQPETNCSEIPNNSDTIYRQDAIDALDAILPVEPMKNEYTQGITCGAALAIEYVKQLPSAQPDLSSYSDKLWRNAYERGKAEAEAEIIRCKECKWFYEGKWCVRFMYALLPDDFCSSAERKEQ